MRTEAPTQQTGPGDAAILNGADNKFTNNLRKYFTRHNRINAKFDMNF